MFNYTTETILNDLTKVSVLLGAKTAPGSGVSWDPGIEAAKKALWIKRLNKFIVAGTFDLVKGATVYKRVTSAATLASSKVTIPTVVVGTLYRVGVQITTNGYADGQFARDRVTYGKPFYVEHVATATTAATMATALAANWNAAFAPYDNFVTASTNSAEFIVTADNNPYIQFKTIIVESIDATTGIGTDLALTVTNTAVGAPAFGDYMWLLKNTRLATIDNYRPFGLNQEELPIAGATYNEYTFKYTAARGTMGQSVVGATGTSETSHVLWVNTAAPSVVRHITGTSGQSGTYTFDEILQAAGLTILAAGDGTTDLTPGGVTEA
jgi:hypothetical protein